MPGSVASFLLGGYWSSEESKTNTGMQLLKHGTVAGTSTTAAGALVTVAFGAAPGAVVALAAAAGAAPFVTFDHVDSRHLGGRK